MVIDPAGLDESVDAYHEEKVPFYGGLSRMVNRNDAAVVATGVAVRSSTATANSAKAMARQRSRVASCGRASSRAPPSGSEMARTQQQRRDETVARLLDASIDTIVEVGYARASAAVITKRAGMSVGALFRHFETMGDFMAATAYEVLRRQARVVRPSRPPRYLPTGRRSRRCWDFAGHHAESRRTPSCTS